VRPSIATASQEPRQAPVSTNPNQFSTEIKITAPVNKITAPVNNGYDERNLI
jgi:hypothetical protein